MDWQLVITLLIVAGALAYTIHKFRNKRPSKKPDAIDVPTGRLIRQAKAKKSRQG